MAPKRTCSSSIRASCELNRTEEWVSSINNEAVLNQLVVDGVLPDRVMVGWCPAHGESFPTPRGDELVVFEDYLYHGFGVPIHPFLSAIELTRRPARAAAASLGHHLIDLKNGGRL